MIGFGARLARWVVRHRWQVIGATVLVTAACAYGMRFLGLNNDTRMFFGRGSRQLQALEDFEDTFGRMQNVLFAIAPADGDVFTRRTLSALTQLTEEAWTIPYSQRVASITSFPYIRAQGNDIVAEPLIADVNSLSDDEIACRKAIILAEPLLLKYVISPSGHVAGINVDLALPGRRDGEMSEVATFVRAMAQEYRSRYPDIAIYLTGGVMLGNAYGEACRKDLWTLAPVMFATLVVLIACSLRSFHASVVTLVVVSFSVFAALGLAGWLGMSLNAASVGAPTLILTLAVADSVHILAAVLHLMRQGKSRSEAIIESVQINFQAVFLTSLTTAIGFLSMNFSESPPFRDLGNITVMGVVAAFFYSILLLPALVAVIPLRSRPDKATTQPPRERLARFIIRRRAPILWGTLAAAVIASVGIVRIELNDNFLDYFDETFDFRRSTDFVLEHLGGCDVIEYALDAEGPGGICDPEYLRTVEAFCDWYRAQPQVTLVQTVTDVIKRVNQALHEDDPDYYAIPRQRELAAQYLLLYEMSLPFGHSLGHAVNMDKSSTRVTVIFDSLDTSAVRAMDGAAQDWLERNAPGHMFAAGTGLSLVWADITTRNTRKMLAAGAGVLLLISGVLALALKSLRVALWSLVPNFIPPLMAFGIWGLTVGRVGLALSVIVSMTIGIVVDDTVHFLSRYIRARRAGGQTPEEAIRHTFSQVGTPIWVTTVALVAGFAVFTLSHYRMIDEMGLMCGAILALALVMDFFCLSTLLLTFDRQMSTLLPRKLGRKYGNNNG